MQNASCKIFGLCYNVYVPSDLDGKYIKTEVFTMAYIITDSCISCGACADNCPTESIYEGDGKYEIDAEKCIDCGTCEDSCPVNAPQAE